MAKPLIIWLDFKKRMKMLARNTMAIHVFIVLPYIFIIRMNMLNPL